MTMAQFSGFPAEGFQFLRELGENNNKPWFEANKDRYRDSVQTPAIALVEELGSCLAAEFPPVSYDTRTNGGSLMRIYRDTRFSADKRPYKTTVAMMFVPPGSKKMAAPGFGLQITPEYAELVAGQFAFQPEQLERYRQAVLADGPGRALEEAAAAVRAAGDAPAAGGAPGGAATSSEEAPNYPLGEPDLKGVPRGFDADHPRARWLRYKGLPVFAPTIPPEVVSSPALVETVMGHFRAMAPIWRWLMEYTIPS